MRKPYSDEATRWLEHARDEFTDADDLYDDPVEAAEASRLAGGVLDLVSRKLGS